MDIGGSRIHTLEGAANFRDLGGLSTSDGREVRRGRVFRSDALYRLTDSDLNVLLALGIRTVIDLRSTEEVRNYGIGPLEKAGIWHVNVPLFYDDPIMAASMVDEYIGLLRHVRDGFRTIFGHLAEDHCPLVLNCFAGKDRTGITSALILGALSVPDHLIVADYALSEQHMARHMHIHRASHDHESLDTLPAWLMAAPTTMEATLAAIAEEWGSVRGYLKSIGLSSDELERIVSSLTASAG